MQNAFDSRLRRSISASAILEENKYHFAEADSLRIDDDEASAKTEDSTAAALAFLWPAAQANLFFSARSDPSGRAPQWRALALQPHSRKIFRSIAQHRRRRLRQARRTGLRCCKNWLRHSCQDGTSAFGIPCGKISNADSEPPQTGRHIQTGTLPSPPRILSRPRRKLFLRLRSALGRLNPHRAPSPGLTMRSSRRLGNNANPRLQKIILLSRPFSVLIFLGHRREQRRAGFQTIQGRL